MISNKLALVIILTWCALLVASSSAAQGCAMCSTVGNGADDPLVQGMFKSILLMVSMPFVLIAVVCGWFYHHLRRGVAGVPVMESPATRVIEFRRP